MERAVKELEGIEVGGDDLDVPYRTALSKVEGLLENPVVIWDSVDVLERHRLFFFLFEEKLPYTKSVGYRTGDSLSTTRLFEEFAAANPHSVDQLLFDWNHIVQEIRVFADLGWAIAHPGSFQFASI